MTPKPAFIARILQCYQGSKNDGKIIKGRNPFYKSEPLNSLFIDVAVTCMSVGVHLSFATLNGDLAL